MPVVEIAGRSVAEHDTVPWLELLDLHLDIVEMRQAVRSRVDSRDFHYFAPMFIVLPLLDQLIRLCQHTRWYHNADLLRSLEIEQQLKLHGLLDW